VKETLTKSKVTKLSDLPKDLYQTVANSAILYGRAHSDLGPSGASRWVKCPGSVVSQTLYPNETSEFAELGTKAHELAEDVLMGKRNLWDTDLPVDCIEAVAEYIRICNEIIDNAGEGATALVEQKVILPYGRNQFGTADIVILAPAQKTIYVGDYKNGQGVLVDAAETWQTRAIACGLLKSKNLKTYMPDGVDTIVSFIVQPRVNTGKKSTRVEWAAEDVIKDFLPTLIEKAEEAFSGNPSFKAGKHCQFCRHRGKCTQAAGEALGSLQFDDDGNLAKVDSLSLEDLSKLYIATEEHFTPWKKSMYAVVHKYLESNVKMENLHLAPKRPSRKWSKDYAEVVDIVKERCKTLGISISDADFYGAPKELSVPQLEKHLKKDGKILEDLFDKKSSGYNVNVGESETEHVAQTAFTDLDIDLQLD